MAQRHEVRAHQFHEIVDPNTEMETLFSHLVFPEGPVWVPDTRALLFTDIPESTIYQSDGVALSVWRTNTNKANGLALDSDSILACEHATSGKNLTLGTLVKWRERTLFCPSAGESKGKDLTRC